MKPLRRRRHNVFLSHAHVDAESVQRLRRWLELAGLEVWYDAEKMLGGAQFPTSLAEGIADSQAMIVAVSITSTESGWVKHECAQGMVHSANHPPFPVIPVVLDQASRATLRDAEPLLAQSAVTAIDGRLSGLEASRLLRGIHAIPDALPPKPLKAQIAEWISAQAGEPTSRLAAVRMPILYVSCGWRSAANERSLNQRLLRALDGFHLIGDAEDHPSTDPARIDAILSGCSGQVVAIPLRGSGELADPEYRSLAREIEIGARRGLPQFFALERGVAVPGKGPVDPIVVDAALLPLDFEADSIWHEWAARIRDVCEPPVVPHFVFVATDYEDLVVQDHVVRHISQVTGLPCLIGKDFGGLTPSSKIEHAIRNATFVIANIVSDSVNEMEPRVNWNSCIEAGIAVGAHRPLHVVARRGTKDRWTIKENLPFMMRNNSVQVYDDDASLIALVHRLARPYRRRILDAH